MACKIIWAPRGTILAPVAVLHVHCGWFLQKCSGDTAAVALIRRAEVDKYRNTMKDFVGQSDSSHLWYRATKPKEMVDEEDSVGTGTDLHPGHDGGTSFSSERKFTMQPDAKLVLKETRAETACTDRTRSPLLPGVIGVSLTMHQTMVLLCCAMLGRKNICTS